MTAIQTDEAVLVFGGCHGNLEATHAIFGAAEAHGIPPERMVCTGDVVAYCADAAATARLVRDSGVWTIMGNCEESLATRAADCGCGFAQGSACDALSAAWYAHADAEMDEDLRAWMRSLPRRLDIAIDGRRLAVVHGSVSVINKFVFESADDEALGEELACAGTEGVIGGHCGLPFTRIVDGLLWHNSGAVGMPANDGTPRIWYSVLTPTSSGLAIDHRALDYDHATAAAKMRAAGLPEGYAAALETGFWPSCEVLPVPEREVRGVAIAAESRLWEKAR